MKWPNTKLVGATLFIIGFLLFGGAIELTIYFAGVRPKIAIPISGYTYPLANHGTVVYLTASEYWAHHACLFGGFALGVLGVWSARKRS